MLNLPLGTKSTFPRNVSYKSRAGYLPSFVPPLLNGRSSGESLRQERDQLKLALDRQLNVTNQQGRVVV